MHKRPCPICLAPFLTLDGSTTGDIKCVRHGDFSNCTSCGDLRGNYKHVCITGYKIAATGQKKSPRRAMPISKTCIYCEKKLRKPGQFCSSHTSIGNSVKYRMEKEKLGFRKAYQAVLERMAAK